MSRTHLIAAPASVNAMADISTLPVTTVADKPKVDSLFDFEEHLNLTAQARRYTWWCLGNKLNSFIIGNLQSHLRMLEREEREVNKPVDRMYADDEQRNRLAEQEAAIEALKAKTEAMQANGFEAQMPAIDIAEILVNLRTVVANKLRVIAETSNTRDTAQSIADTLAYRLSITPAADDTKLMRLHLLTKIPLDALKKADLTNKIDERARLLAHAPRIIELADELAWKNHPVADHEVEALFDQLPAFTRYRLIASVIKILNAAMAAEVKALVRFGRADAITNRILINEVMNAYIVYFQKFTHDNAAELEAYEERGFALPTLEEVMADPA